MKNLVFSLLAARLMASACLTGLAAEASTALVATLTSETGERIPVSGRLVKQELTATPARLGLLEFGSANRYECKFYIPTSARGIDGSTYRPLEALDVTYSVTAYLTGYYSYETMNPASGNTEYLLTRVAGSYRNGDPTVQVTSSKLEYGCIQANELDQFVPYYEIANPFDVYTGFTQYCEMFMGAAGVVGASYKLSLKRNTSTWTFILDNKYPL